MRYLSQRSQVINYGIRDHILKTIGYMTNRSMRQSLSGLDLITNDVLYLRVTSLEALKCKILYPITSINIPLIAMLWHYKEETRLLIKLRHVNKVQFIFKRKSS